MKGISNILNLFDHIVTKMFCAFQSDGDIMFTKLDGWVCSVCTFFPLFTLIAQQNKML